MAVRDLLADLKDLGIKVGLGEPLSQYTTVGIGGPAEILVEVETVEELIKVTRAAKKWGVKVTILGWGSNVLVGDKGIGGLVIINKADEISIGEVSKKVSRGTQKQKIEARWQSDKTRGTFKYEFADLDYDESDKKRVRVKLASGVALPYAINYLLDKGITGLQWYSRIPGTIGGAIFNNIHGGTHFIFEVVERVRILDEKGEDGWLELKHLGGDYDWSWFHSQKEVILEAELLLYQGNVEQARAAAAEWARRKSLQPSNTPGCAFANIDAKEMKRLKFPTTSVGYLVEHELGLSGFQVGGAKISRNHHNFIENTGGSTAADYRAVMGEVARRAKEKLGIELKPEIILLGEF